MSSLKEFIDYKSNCPICNGLLNLSFFFKSKSKINIQYDELVIDVPFSGFPLTKNRYSYTAKYYINPITNTFSIHFLDKNKQQYNLIYFSIIEKYFKFLESQANAIKFYKECTVCRKYNYSSNPLFINHKSCKIENISVATEYLCLSDLKSNNDFINIYKLFNYYTSNKSIIMNDLSTKSEYDRMGEFNVKQTPFKNFIEINNSIDLSNMTIKELINRLKLYLILS